MFDSPEDDWQRDTHHPSSRALLHFLKSDVERGLCLMLYAKAERDAGRGIPSVIESELDHLRTEVGRWLERARDRRVPLGALTARVISFLGEIDSVRRDHHVVQ